jgi:hypothetical protein
MQLKEDLMTDTFRALCAELAAVEDALTSKALVTANQGQALDGFSALAHFRGIADRAQAALAQPEPQGPSDEELESIAGAAGIAFTESDEDDLGLTGVFIEGEESSLYRFARAVLARWGRPALAQPESQGESCPGCEGTPSTSNSPCAVCGQLAQPEPQALTVQECNDMHKHRENYIYECSDGEIQLDGYFSREDLLELARTIPANPQSPKS